MILFDAKLFIFYYSTLAVVFLFCSKIIEKFSEQASNYYLPTFFSNFGGILFKEYLPFSWKVFGITRFSWKTSFFIFSLYITFVKQCVKPLLLFKPGDFLLRVKYVGILSRNTMLMLHTHLSFKVNNCFPKDIFNSDNLF